MVMDAPLVVRRYSVLKVWLVDPEGLANPETATA
jgi:hypothetical protein